MKLTTKEAVEKIRDHILCGNHSDGIIAPILNWCDKALADYDASEDEKKPVPVVESPKRKEAREIREMQLTTPMAKMFQEALASDLDHEADMEERKLALPKRNCDRADAWTYTDAIDLFLKENPKVDHRVNIWNWNEWHKFVQWIFKKPPAKN